MRKFQDDDESQRRRRKGRAAAIALDADPNVVMRVLLHSPKDTLAALVAVAAILAIIINATVLQAGRHPSPMFGKDVSVSFTQTSTPQPLPRPRPADSDLRIADLKPLDPRPMIEPRSAADTKAPAAQAKTASAPARPPAAIPASTKADPLGDLITSNRRVAAVQRALTEYGYGQLKPTGVIGPDTQAAISKFERERKMTPTGQLSDRLIRDLSALTGRPIE